MMKILPFLSGLTALFFAGALALPLAAEVMIGDEREVVMQILGPPKGHIGSQKYGIYYFDRGEVVFRDGKVHALTLISTEELRQNRVAAERKREVMAQRQEEEQERRIEEGLTRRNQALSNPAFTALPARERLTFWETFRRNYPEIDVEFDYLVAARQAQTDAAERAEARRQAQAEESRLHQLEQRIKESERQAQLAREREQRARWRYDSPYYYPARQPVVIVRDHSGERRHGYRGDRDQRGSHSKEPPSREQERRTTEPTGTTSFERSEARRQDFNTQWEARQQAFDSEGQARQRAFEARRDAAWRG